VSAIARAKKSLRPKNKSDAEPMNAISSGAINRVPRLVTGSKPKRRFAESRSKP
jgi:hypothetical protein